MTKKERRLCQDLLAACRAALTRLQDPYLGEDEGQRQASEIAQLERVIKKAEKELN